jgi:hypothetical protein
MPAGCGVLVAVVLLGVLATVALAKPATGHYSATGSVSFTFSIAKGSCRTPPDPSNPASSPGPFGHGLCFRTREGLIPSPPLTCPPGTSLSGDHQFDVGFFDKLRFSPSGSLVAKVYTEGSTTEYQELSLKVTGRTASGFVEQTLSIGSDGGFCDSGQLQFTAKHG